MPDDRPLQRRSSDTRESSEGRLLDELLGMASEARAERLRTLSVEAPELVARVGSLLAELNADDGFLSPGGALGGALFDELRQRLSDELGPPPSLSPGSPVGSYRILERVGVGGMGEVYRATDTTLGRDVAIKVLPTHLEGRQDRTAQLQREARLLAALNHPNVATIYELENIGERLALVMELVEGPTLAERLQQGPLAVHEVIGMARQLVDGVEAAHARGVVHRDLKPGNVKIAASGRLKVLDFGIARVLRDQAGVAAWPDLSPLTTLSLPSGAVLGTASYMSPEQARGEAPDQRTDIWAFGCVLFEMLAGTRAYDGTSPAEVMARVLGHPPALDLLPAGTPAPLRHLIARCLEKDAARRLSPIADARAYLDAAANGHATPAPAQPAERAARWRQSPWNALPAVLGLALGAAVSGLVVWTVMQPLPQPVVRLTVPIPTTDELVTGALPSIALSPDGTTIAYRARRDGELQLFRRALGEAEPTVVPDSANATAPFFSPDGAWIGFDRDGVLMKVAVTGGMPVSICDTGGVSAAASWSDRGEIVFATTTGHGLRRVRAAGGPPTPLTAVNQAHGETLHALPDVLPGGRAAVFTVQGNESATIAAVRFDTGEVRRLTEGQQARYGSSGHLLVARGDTIWAARFDPNTLTLGSEPVPVLKGLDPAGAAHFALAHNGALAYVPPADQDPVKEDARRDRVATRRQLLFVQHWDNELTALVRRSR